MYYTKNSLTTLLFIAFFALFSANTLQAQTCTHPDYEALENFYTATSGDTWVNKSGWLSDCEPCNWFGVNCDEDGRVSSLVLRGNALIGELPADIGNLDKLTLINLSYNKIGGTLPATLFTAPALKDINLTGNMISGSIPATLGDQPLLENLRLSYNLLSGEVPATLANFLDMEILTLNNNGFTGSIPEGLGDLPEIFSLDLSENDFAGCFPLDLSTFCGQDRIRFNGNPKLSWSGDFSSFCGNGLNEEQTGAPCDDGNPDTAGDIISADCGCGGTLDPSGLVDIGGELMDEGTPTVEEGTAPNMSNTRSLTAPGQPLLTTTSLTTRVFPNPVVGNEVNVQLPIGVDGGQLRLLSLAGRVIAESRATGNTSSMPVPVLEAGVYLIETVTEQGRSVNRIIVN